MAAIALLPRCGQSKETWATTSVAVMFQIDTMSGDREKPYERNKSYFCKVCQVAYLNGSGLYQHYKDEEHKKMEDAYYGQKYGKYSYSSLQDYISCLSRREPLIGLQYIIQLYPEVDCDDAFKCSLCKVIGPLYFIIKHIESLRHRKTYLDSKSCNSRIGVKNDFWKYNIERQEKLDEYKKKLSVYEIQKNNILKYMETLVITSPEEFMLVEGLTEELEAAVNVFTYNTKPRYEKSYKRKREQSTGYHERKHSRSDFSHSKKRSIWYGKEYRPSSSSSCKDEVRSVSNKHSVTEEARERKRSRSASKDMLLKVTFSTGSVSESKTENVQEPHESPTLHPDNEKLVGASNHLSETTSSYCEWSNINTDRVQEIRAKRIRKHSTELDLEVFAEALSKTGAMKSEKP
ncbi:uncharacterized protein LOC143782314 isoform X9 [Ranitomeya variabilis]|uniref:uncharacterized protein LOC143782314 isoform X9 n=1 Tax=Ranitomeya variabilis TaxID=490064 RepID=UPI004055E356